MVCGILVVVSGRQQANGYPVVAVRSDLFYAVLHGLLKGEGMKEGDRMRHDGEDYEAVRRPDCRVQPEEICYELDDACEILTALMNRMETDCRATMDCDALVPAKVMMDFGIVSRTRTIMKMAFNLLYAEKLCYWPKEADGKYVAKDKILSAMNARLEKAKKDDE